jgi:tetratricopeptide (TPR) repeat protein
MSQGSVLADSGKSTDGIRDKVEAPGVARGMADATPTDSRVHRLLAYGENSSGWVLYQMGQPSEALPHFERSRVLWQRLSDSEPANAENRNHLANIDVNLAAALLAAGRPEEARAPIERALAVREALVSANPQNGSFAHGLAETLLWTGEGRRVSNDIAGAAACWRRACVLYASQPPQSGEPKMCEACCHAQLSGLAGRAGSGVSAEDGLAEAERALQTLKRAMVGGYRPLDWLRNETALNPIRDTPEFQRLLLDAALPPDPFARED